MNVLLKALPVLLAFCTGAAQAQAQLYKWVGPDGKVTYSDVPPPSTAAQVETRPAASAGTVTVDLPYELAQAVRNHPVTLYTAPNCAPCDEGRKLLSDRGVPFREKTVTSNEDIQQLRQAGGDTTVPLLILGRTVERRFEPSTWDNALTVAGYPATSRLPRSYRNPAPEAAVPRPEVKMVKQTQASAPQAEAPPSATELPPPIGNAPPGFRF